MKGLSTGVGGVAAPLLVVCWSTTDHRHVTFDAAEGVSHRSVCHAFGTLCGGEVVFRIVDGRSLVGGAETLRPRRDMDYTIDRTQRHCEHRPGRRRLP